MAEETMELIGKATVPGAYLCDLIPICKFLYPDIAILISASIFHLQ